MSFRDCILPSWASGSWFLQNCDAAEAATKIQCDCEGLRRISRRLTISEPFPIPPMRTLVQPAAGAALTEVRKMTLLVLRL